MSLGFLPSRRAGDIPGLCPASFVWGMISEDAALSVAAQHCSLPMQVFNDAALSLSSFLHGSRDPTNPPTTPKYPSGCLLLALMKKGRMLLLQTLKRYGKFCSTNPCKAKSLCFTCRCYPDQIPSATTCAAAEEMLFSRDAGGEVQICCAGVQWFTGPCAMLLQDLFCHKFVLKFLQHHQAQHLQLHPSCLS